MSGHRIPIEVAIPRCPNYLLAKNGTAYALGGFTDRDLRRIGRDFTAAMLQRAKEQRAAKERAR